MKNVIEIHDLKKNYKDFSLNINELEIPSGQIIGLIGENGNKIKKIIEPLDKKIKEKIEKLI